MEGLAGPLLLLALVASYVFLVPRGWKTPATAASAAAPQLPAPPSAEGMQFRPLGGGVLLAEQFLSMGEVRWLRKLVQRKDVGGWQASRTGGKTFASPALGPSFAAAMRADPIVARVRVLFYTGSALRCDVPTVHCAAV